jgi:hypothetical protein
MVELSDKWVKGFAVGSIVLLPNIVAMVAIPSWLFE